jgi:lysozyme
MNLNMTASPWLYNFLKNYEKFRPTAYRPTPKDVWTCGFGHTKGVTQTTTCTMTQALEWLQNDAAQAVLDVCQHVTTQLTQNQFDALCSLCFNIGVGNFNGSGLLRYVNGRMFTAAAADFVNWDKQAGDVLPGLLTRREAEAQHFSS